MKKTILSIFAVLSSLFCFSQKSLQDMKEPYVKVINNSNIIEDYTLLTNKKTGANIQIASLSKSDVNLIHRDYFIALSSFYNMIIIYGIMEEMGSEENVLIETLKKPIGEPDIKIIMNFSEDGLQMSTITPEGRENETITWDQMFK